jgi:hypothetical protein
MPPIDKTGGLPLKLPFPSRLKLFMAINAESVDTSYGDDGFTPSLLVLLEYAFFIFAVQCLLKVAAREHCVIPFPYKSHRVISSKQPMLPPSPFLTDKVQQLLASKQKLLSPVLVGT